MNNQTAFDCVERVAATLKPRASEEVGQLLERLLHAAPERTCHVLIHGNGNYGGLYFLSRKYGTETTADAYAAVVTLLPLPHPLPDTMGLYERLGADQQAEDLLELILQAIEGDVLRLWCGSYATDKRMHKLARAVFDARLASAAPAASGWDPSSVNVCVEDRPDDWIAPLVLSNENRTVGWSENLLNSRAWDHIYTDRVLSEPLLYTLSVDVEIPEIPGKILGHRELAVGVVDPNFKFDDPDDCLHSNDNLLYRSADTPIEDMEDRGVRTLYLNGLNYGTRYAIPQAWDGRGFTVLVDMQARILSYTHMRCNRQRV
jgi:hypothetical protein